MSQLQRKTGHNKALQPTAQPLRGFASAELGRSVHKMNLWNSILEEWLPTKLSRLIAAASLSLAIGAIFLPESLSTIQVQLSKETALLVRLVAPLSICLVGSFSVLVCVARYSRSRCPFCRSGHLSLIGSKISQRPPHNKDGYFRETYQCDVCRRTIERFRAPTDPIPLT